jgi:hypothetical protein
MGLDTLELVMAFEDEFGIAIPDAAASEMVTVDRTVQYIVAQLRAQPAPAGVCTTARAFYRLRKKLVDRFGVSRSQVRTDTAIGSLVEKRRRREWSKIADASGLRREPNALFKPGFPPPHTSIRTLIETRNKSAFRRFDGTIDEAAVFQQVREIISFQLGVPIWSIHRDTRYIEDLGSA